MGLAVVGSITFIVQREQVVDAVDARLKQQVDRLRTIAGGVESAGATAAGSEGAATVEESIDAADYTSVDAYLHDVVANLVPARNEGSVALLDGAARYQPSTLSGFDISQDDELIRRALEETRGGATRIGTVHTANGTLRYIAIPVAVTGDPHEGVYVRAVDLAAELRPVTMSMTTFGIAAAAVLVASGVVGWHVARRILRPIRHMRETADAITLDDLSPRLVARGDDDIADLTRTVNSMLDRLEDSVDGQRQLLDDVRHELKTPITIVRGHLEMMDAGDAADVAATREIGIAELDRLARLVEDIDLLAAAQDEVDAVGDVDLEVLTGRLHELVSVIPGHSWSVAETARGTVRGDSDRLLQAWLQLADNAAKYTPAGSPIEIGSARDEAGARLWVRDRGPGIPPAARQSVFRRFGRAATPREVGGSGLGLAIVEAIAHAHGGVCRITDTPGGGATFTVHLPAHELGVAEPVSAGAVVQQRKDSE